MEQNWLTIEVNEKGQRVLGKCAKEAEGEVVIPQGVTVIGAKAFEGCDRITSLVIPEGLNRISHTAFFNGGKEAYCPSLSTIHFPTNFLLKSSVWDTKNTLFRGTAWYENQPSGVVYAGDNAIGYKGEMPKDTEIVIKDGTKHIGYQAFDGHSNLVSIILPDSLVTIGIYAFRRCNSLSLIHFSPNVSLPVDCGLKDTIWYDYHPNGVVYAGPNAMGYKGKSPEGSVIEIAEGTKFIVPQAFRGMINVEKVILPKSLVDIGYDAFEGCSSLEAVLSTDSDSEVSEKESPAAKGCIGRHAFFNCEKLETVTVPSAVSIIKANAFYYCKSLKMLRFLKPSSIETIENSDLHGDIEFSKLVFDGCGLSVE